MRTCVRMALAVFAATLLTATAAGAQVQNGNISIKAVDDQGAVMPGANVVITSPVLPRPIEGTTDTSGVFQVPGLTPGTYTVKVTLQGFQSLIREDVIVRQGQTVSIEAPMKLGSVSEAITVKGESPVVDTKTVGSRTNIDSALLETTPGGKDIWNILEYKAPGVVVESPDVGGNQGGLQRSMSARGTPERAEHAAAERRQRQRPGGAGLLDELLHPERVREHPGLDRRAGHRDRHRRRADQHGHQERDQRVQGRGAADLPGQAARRARTSTTSCSRRGSGRTRTRRS